MLHDQRDFRDLLVTVGASTGAGAAIVEKDYWVSMALRAIASGFDDGVVFKGGTSLSKALGLITRFSEDIDILVRADLHELAGRGSRDRYMKAIERAVGDVGGLTFVDAGRSERGISRTSVFRYEPKVDSLIGLNPTIVLEMGIRGGPFPKSRRSMTSILESEVARVVPNASDDFELDVLDPRRTFVEKLFAIHSACALWQEGRSTALARQSRHLADLYALAGVVSVGAFVGTDEYATLVKDVDAIGAEYFPRDHRAPDGLRFTDSLALTPPRDLRVALDDEYESSAFLFYGGRPSLDEVYERLAPLRGRL